MLAGSTGESLYSTAYDTVWDKTRQLDYYEENGVTTTNNSEKVIKKYKGTSASWWLRNAEYESYSSFLAVNSNGQKEYSSNTYTYVVLGVAPAFRIGQEN